MKGFYSSAYFRIVKEHKKNFPLSLSLTIEPLTTSDLGNVTKLQPEGWSSIIESITFYCDSPFCFPLKATANGKLVGTGTAIIHGTTAWLAHIIVDKTFRNAGIGLAITRALIKLISEKGCETQLLLATALGEPVYKKCGFEVQEQYVFMEGGKLPDPEASLHITAFDKSFRQKLYELDRYVSGEHREKLLDIHIDKTHLWVNDSELRGYYAPTLGDGLIVATDEGAGIELMRLRNSFHSTFCLPVSNVNGIDFLTKHGFQEIRKASRMILGKSIAWKPAKIYSRIGGNLG